MNKNTIAFVTYLPTLPRCLLSRTLPSTSLPDERAGEAGLLPYCSDVLSNSEVVAPGLMDSLPSSVVIIGEVLQQVGGAFLRSHYPAPRLRETCPPSFPLPEQAVETRSVMHWVY